MERYTDGRTDGADVVQWSVADRYGQYRRPVRRHRLRNGPGRPASRRRNALQGGWVGRWGILRARSANASFAPAAAPYRSTYARLDSAPSCLYDRLRDGASRGPSESLAAMERGAGRACVGRHARPRSTEERPAPKWDSLVERCLRRASTATETNRTRRRKTHSPARLGLDTAAAATAAARRDVTDRLPGQRSTASDSRVTWWRPYWNTQRRVNADIHNDGRTDRRTDGPTCASTACPGLACLASQLTQQTQQTQRKHQYHFYSGVLAVSTLLKFTGSSCV